MSFWLSLWFPFCFSFWLSRIGFWFRPRCLLACWLICRLTDTISFRFFFAHCLWLIFWLRFWLYVWLFACFHFGCSSGFRDLCFGFPAWCWLACGFTLRLSVRIPKTKTAFLVNPFVTQRAGVVEVWISEHSKVYTFVSILAQGFRSSILIASHRNVFCGRSRGSGLLCW